VLTSFFPELKSATIDARGVATIENREAAMHAATVPKLFFEKKYPASNRTFHVNTPTISVHHGYWRYKRDSPHKLCASMRSVVEQLVQSGVEDVVLRPYEYEVRLADQNWDDAHTSVLGILKGLFANPQDVIAEELPWQSG
jgi:hypothetical protein